jgi:predicted HicB family RNase H-like nuclease
MTITPNLHTYRVTWSEEDQEYVALCAEFPSLSHLDEDPDKAFQGIRRLVAAVVRDLARAGDDIPEPLATQRFSGKFVARVPPDLHRRLAIEAAEAGISLNRLVSLKLAG